MLQLRSRREKKIALVSQAESVPNVCGNFTYL